MPDYHIEHRTDPPLDLRYTSPALTPLGQLRSAVFQAGYAVLRSARQYPYLAELIAKVPNDRMEAFVEVMGLDTLGTQGATQGEAALRNVVHMAFDAACDSDSGECLHISLAFTAWLSGGD